MQFYRVPGVLAQLEQCVGNELVVVVQPDECIYWKVQNKVPGLKFEVEQVRWRACARLRPCHAVSPQVPSLCPPAH